ncbi:MAG: TraR/DksA C4-type zinc finger protein, partial [Planctomycetia bacterium]|nr:TraR/DksA C4-type zinc finger protein [Planctomycetia bacterium]
RAIGTASVDEENIATGKTEVTGKTWSGGAVVSPTPRVAGDAGEVASGVASLDFSGPAQDAVAVAEDPWIFELTCTACGRREFLTQTGVFEFLRSRRRIRATTDASPEMIREIFLFAVPKSYCPGCRQKKLTAIPAKNDSGDDLWKDVGPVLCEDCGKPIPPERLAIVPETKVCVQCKRQREQDGIWNDGDCVSGYDPRGTEGDYCPRCGAAMKLRASGGEDQITRYVSVCSAGCRSSRKR